MFKSFAIACGGICVLAGIAMGFHEFAGTFVVLLGLALILLRRYISLGMLIITAGIGVMPMDGSWLLFSATVVASLVFAWFAAVCVYEMHGSVTDLNSWRDISRIALAFCVPVAGLSLVRYLVETDRSVVSGLILVAVFAYLGYKLMPRTIIRVPRPRISKYPA